MGKHPEYSAPKPGSKVSLDDWLTEQELALCKAEREKANRNGSAVPVHYCDCSECVVNGHRQPMVKGHDCRYVHERSALVEQAAARATEKAGFVPYGDQTWTRCFVSEMEKLSA